MWKSSSPTSIFHIYSSFLRLELTPNTDDIPLSTFPAHRWTRGIGWNRLHLGDFLISTITFFLSFSMKSTSLFTLSTSISVISDSLSHEIFKFQKATRNVHVSWGFHNDQITTQHDSPFKRVLSSSAIMSSPHATHPAIAFFATIWHRLECRIVLFASKNPRSNFP